MSTKKKEGQGAQRRGAHKGPPYKTGGPGVRKPGRREWMKECLKLLEAMMELEDSKPFREPVDCAKFPDYYTVVADPIDLSKINFKFRGNQYNDPDEFASDIRQLFGNYRLFFKDPQSEIYTQLHRLSWWFDAEYKRIVDKWGFRWMHWHSNSSSQGGSTSMEEGPSCSPPPPSAPMTGGSLQGPPMQQLPSHSPPVPQGAMPDIPPYMPMVPQQPPPQQYMMQANMGPNMPPQGMPPNPVSMPPMPSYSSAPPSVPYTSIPTTYTTTQSYTSAPYASIPGPTYTNHSPTGYSSSLPNPPLPAPIPIITSTPPEHNASPPPRIEHHRPRAPSLAIGGRQYSEEEPGPLSIIVPEKTPPPMTREPSVREPMRDTVSHHRDTPVSHRASPAESERSDLGLDQLELTIANTNVWFGPVRLRSQQPVILREDGFSFFVCTDSGHEFPIDIKADEIVRCVAHLGSNKKHTIFLFILPNCTKRLQDLDIKFGGCSLIVIFTSTLSSLQISLMLHIFHNMSKNSIFGNLFSETDQNGALALLANIKPGAVHKMVEKGKEVTSSRSLDVEFSRLEEEDRIGEHRPMHGHGNRLQVPSIGQERRSLSLNDAPMVAAANASQQESRPLDLSSATTDNSMWNGAVHSNRNLSRTKFHFKQRSLEVKNSTANTCSPTGGTSAAVGPPPAAAAVGGSGGGSSSSSTAISSSMTTHRATPPRLGQMSSGGHGMGSGSGLLRKTQRQYAVDNGSDDEDISLPPPPPLGHSGTGSSQGSIQESSCEDMDTRDLHKHEASKQSSLSSSRGSQCSTSDDLVMTEVRVSNRCPITQQVMRNPVRNRCCQHCYDREGVEQLIRQRGTKARCPVVGCTNDKPLHMGDMTYDYDLWKQIQATLDRVEQDYPH